MEALLWVLAGVGLVVLVILLIGMGGANLPDVLPGSKVRIGGVAWTVSGAEMSSDGTRTTFVLHLVSDRAPDR